MKTIFTSLLCFVATLAFCQLDKDSETFLELAKLDSLLFDRAFNHCETEVLEKLISEKIEFFHDQSGITNDKAAFIKSIEQNICGNPNAKPIRKLVPGSLEVFPLYNNGSLYGAIQSGEHKFYIAQTDQEPFLTSTAKFTHVWIKNETSWEVRNVLSYDHQNPKDTR